jgi:hypothetical protein
LEMKGKTRWDARVLPFFIKNLKGDLYEKDSRRKGSLREGE